MSVLFISLPVCDVIFALVVLDFEILSSSPIVFFVDKLALSVEDHWPRVFDGITPWGEEGISLVAFCAGGRNFNDRGLLVERVVCS